jgi:4-hydroxy-3-methylbut-2-en-1-yl diphosphate reductase
MSVLVIVAPLLIEARALRRGLRPAAMLAGRPALRVLRSGMGPRAAGRLARRLPQLAPLSTPVVVAGFGGGLLPEIRTGDVVVATEIRGPGGVITLPVAAALFLAQMLRSTGLTVRLGPIVSSERLALGGRRADLAAAEGLPRADRDAPSPDMAVSDDAALGASGPALAVDMESYWLLEDNAGPAAVVRAISDTAGAGPLGGMLPVGWLRAYRSLVKIGAVLEEWAATLDRVTG